MSAETVALQAYTAMMQGKRRIVHGVQNKIGTWFSQIAPRSLVLFTIESVNKSK